MAVRSLNRGWFSNERQNWILAMGKEQNQCVCVYNYKFTQGNRCCVRVDLQSYIYQSCSQVYIWYDSHKHTQYVWIREDNSMDTLRSVPRCAAVSQVLPITTSGLLAFFFFFLFFFSVFSFFFYIQKYKTVSFLPQHGILVWSEPGFSRAFLTPRWEN